MNLEDDNVTVTKNYVENNLGDVAGNMLKIMVTEVKSQSCDNPYCDNIIAVEKAEFRQGYCVSCYESEVRDRAFNAGKKPFSFGFYIFLALIFVYFGRLIHWFIVTFFYKEQLSAPVVLLEPLLGIIVMTIGTKIAVKRQKEVEAQHNLHSIKMRKEQAMKQSNSDI